MDSQTLILYTGVFFALVLVGWLTRTLFRLVRWVLVKWLRNKTPASMD